MAAVFVSVGTAALDTLADVSLSTTRKNTRKIIIQAADNADLIYVKDRDGNIIGEIRNGQSFVLEVSRAADRAGHHLNCANYKLRATTANKDVRVLREVFE